MTLDRRAYGLLIWRSRFVGPVLVVRNDRLGRHVEIKCGRWFVYATGGGGFSLYLFRRLMAFRPIDYERVGQ